MNTVGLWDARILGYDNFWGNDSGGARTRGAISSSSYYSSSSPRAAEWAQCGGIGWTGATTCQSPLSSHSYLDRGTRVKRRDWPTGSK